MSTTAMSMYAMNSFQADTMVELPTVMYKSRSYHDDSQQENVGPVAALERRQESVLQRLKQLQSSVSRLKQQYNIPDTVTKPSDCGEANRVNHDSLSARWGGKSASIPSLGSGILDLVINVSPTSIPLSLMVLCEQLCQNYAVIKATHVHSSVSDSVPDHLRNLLISNGSMQRTNAQMAITLVWKKVDNGPQLVVDPTASMPVMGEVNIARYLTRLLQPGVDSDDIVKATQVDELLDIAQLQVISGNVKERAAAVRSLNATLGKQDWLTGTHPCVADVVLWSALHQTGQTDSLPSNIKKWLKLCSQNALFLSALKCVN